MSTTNILDMNNRIEELEKNSGGGGSADSAKRSDIATEFSTETSYTAGNFVYYEGKLYQFNADHAAGAWDPTDVVEANVTDQIVSNKAAIEGLTASDVAYDNTTSGLTATNEQAAIDELAGDISGLTASDVNYVNTTSGLTATDVQGAVDELTAKIGLKIKYFDVTAPSGVSSYDFSNDRPSDLKDILSAMSIRGDAAVISQTGASKIFFYNTLSGNSQIRIMYVAY